MRFLRDNGLTLALCSMFLLCLGGMFWTGWLHQNSELARHGAPAVDLVSYFFSSEFQSTLFENWESEFLQMSAYVIMTAMLFQRGSAESKDPDGDNPEESDPTESRHDPNAPWPVRAGGIWLKLYSHSLGILLLMLFFVSFILHWLHSVGAANEEAALHGEAPQTALEYLADPQLWFESLQNWQSEFLSTAVLVVLSIVLRYRGSPESKPVAAPHSATGR
jgi:membrane protein implicated in regulation of membrane protease activity